MNYSMPTFHRWWKDRHAHAKGVSVSTINTWWNQGNGKLDTAAAKAGYWDYSTDFCSNSPDTGPHFNFKHSCSRHDYGWRNLKKMHSRWGNVNTVANRQYVNLLFARDLYDHCNGRSIVIRGACKNTADIYIAAVGVAGVM